MYTEAKQTTGNSSSKDARGHLGIPLLVKQVNTLGHLTPRSSRVRLTTDLLLSILLMHYLDDLGNLSSYKHSPLDIYANNKITLESNWMVSNQVHA